MTNMLDFLNNVQGIQHIQQQINITCIEDLLSKQTQIDSQYYRLLSSYLQDAQIKIVYSKCKSNYDQEEIVIQEND
ncbi:unnamed protein product [Paramecium sonneborni]|uniref:Uncharacterized protein n=1 Tax=Paramecium sonneborni TaxID=65129 RepID=A0A8S1QI95_9CILI|nr:unnamed protein product [Paramecium sonneborni]